jgi:4-amino-4-deoxy-L-arabinose transferase-like glycosyltransferase
LRRAGLALALAGALYFILFLEAACQPFEIGDETWTLQVLQRISTGDVLYRDVFFGATPLSVWVSTAATRVFGVEILVLRTLRVLLFVATILLCGEASHRVSGRTGPALFAMLGVVSLSVRTPEGLYSTLSVFFLLLCFRATWEWLSSPNAWLLAAAGGAAGLAFVSKQNVGIAAYAAAAVAAASVESADSTRARRLGSLTAAFAVPVVLAFLPVWLSGGLAGLLDYGFLGKGAYLRVGGVSPLEGLRPWREPFEGGRPAGALILASAGSIRYWVIPLTLGALVWFWTRTRSGPRREREHLLAVSAFSVAAVVIVFPRFDPTHLGHALPLLAVGLAFVWSRTGMRAGRPIGWALTLVLGAFFLARYGRSVGPALSGLSTGSWSLSTLPHFRGVAVPGVDETRLRDDGRRLAASADKGQLLILTTYPSVLYLVSGVRNPTPFDYPLVTAFGLSGSTRVLAALESGAIGSVCFAPAATESQRPQGLEQFVQTRMSRVSDLGPCTLYRRHD